MASEEPFRRSEPPSRTGGNDAVNVMTAPVKFTASTRSHSARSIDPAGLGGRENPGVGEDAVDRFQLIGDCRDRCGQRCDIGDVDAARHNSSARHLRLFDDLLQPIPVLIHRNDACALFDSAQDRGATDPTRRPGNEDHPILKAPRHALTVW